MAWTLATQNYHQVIFFDSFRLSTDFQKKKKKRFFKRFQFLKKKEKRKRKGFYHEKKSFFVSHQFQILELRKGFCLKKGFHCQFQI